MPSDAWRGIYPAICTPFRPDDEVDLDAQRRVVRFVLEGGAHGIVAFGLAGEVLKLSTDERKDALRGLSLLARAASEEMHRKSSRTAGSRKQQSPGSGGRRKK